MNTPGTFTQSGKMAGSPVTASLKPSRLGRGNTTASAASPSVLHSQTSNLSPSAIRRKFEDSDDARSYEEHQRKKRIANMEAEARKIRRKLKEPIQFLKGEEHLITRKEKQIRKMQKIDRKYHKEINNRKV